MLRIIICVFLFLSFQADAQLTEDFSDGDFVKDPVWTATPGSWIINPSGQLQSANVTAGSTFQITTANELATETEWEFSLALLFNTSSANYVDVFLVASGSDLTSSKTTGYFVRIGNTQDEVSLYRKDADAPPVRLIDGVDGTTNKSSNTLRIRIIRDASDMFTLYTDPTGTGSTFRTEGQKEDHLYARSLFFGFLVKQSTSSFFQKHYINLVTIAPYKPDLTPPALVAATATSLQTLDLLFSEPVDPATALEKERYEVDGGIGNPAAVTPDPANQALLHLQFGVPFPNGGMQSINLSGISDLAGNRSGLLTASFHFYKPVPFDVIIDEVLADPSPAVQLPLAEWIEVKNRSGHDLDLKDWTLKAGTATSGKFPAYLLKTDSFVILCASTNLPALQRFGSVLAIPSFPTLNNEGEVLVLQTPAGEQMHRVGYQASWYNSAAKREGGWSLEMIDTEAPCLDAKNWMESSNPNGGTPGRVNSVNNQPVSRLPPALKEITLVTDTSLLLQFEEPLDSLFAASADHYSLTNGITVRSVQVSGPLFLEVRLQLSGPLQKGQSYTLQFMAADCKGNSGEQSKILGVPEVPLKQDLVINELLFDPPPSGSDYVEFYNNSHKVIELKDLKIAGRSAGGRLRSVLPVTTTSRLLFPGDYIVLTEDKDALQKQYLVKDPRTVLELAALPSLPNDTGVLAVLIDSVHIIDELAYSSKWHFPLIADPEGVALERISAGEPTQNSLNWHSAASTAGYGTPGYRNSQSYEQELFLSAFHISPKIFSPDNDGVDDEATIAYQLESGGYVANVFIFNDQGRQVQHLAKNDLLAPKGYWRWNGLDDKNVKLPSGIYVIYIEAFSLQGEKRSAKLTIIKK